jgi:hypothetical protein
MRSGGKMMNLKTVVAGLIGLVIGVAGYYLVARSPNVIEPSTPSNLALMFGQDVNSNAAYPAKSLMTPSARRLFTSADWQALRHWAGNTGGYGFATYEVLTFPNHHSLTLWITTPIGGPGNQWEIQQIQEARTASSPMSAALVKAPPP